MAHSQKRLLSLPCVYSRSGTYKLASAWIASVWGAHASRVLLSAARRERIGWLGRPIRQARSTVLRVVSRVEPLRGPSLAEGDAQTDTRDACAPLTTGIGYC